MFLPILTDKPVLITNVPRITDIQKNLEILKSLGASLVFDKNTIEIECRDLSTRRISQEEATATTGSKFLIPLLTARFGNLETFPSGGDDIGDRGFDNYVNLIKKFGIGHEKFSGGLYKFHLEDRFEESIELPFPSYGLTVLAVLCGMRHRKPFEIGNISIEPEIFDFLDTVELFGVKVFRIDVGRILIEPHTNIVEKIHYTNSMDRNVAATYLIAATAKKKKLILEGFDNRGFGKLFETLNALGAEVTLDENSVTIDANECFSKTADMDLSTHIFPMLHSDWNAMLSVVLTQQPGSHCVQELLFEDRMKHWPELGKMGVDYEFRNPRRTRLVKGRPSFVSFQGDQPFLPADVYATDLRTGAALLMAASLTKGSTEIQNIGEVYRGYEDLPLVFSKMFDDFHYEKSAN